MCHFNSFLFATQNQITSCLKIIVSCWHKVFTISVIFQPFIYAKKEKSIAILAWFFFFFFLLLFTKQQPLSCLSMLLLVLWVYACQYPLGSCILHMSRWEVVCRVSDPGDAYTALGTSGPFRFVFYIEFNVELSNPQLLVTWMRPTKSNFSILFLF